VFSPIYALRGGEDLNTGNLRVVLASIHRLRALVAGWVAAWVVEVADRVVRGASAGTSLGQPSRIVFQVGFGYGFARPPA
jgi:hypothetical protein